MAIEKPPLVSIVNDLLNPSFEAVGAPVELRRNLVPNPSFEHGSSSVEVRRNLSRAPVWNYVPSSPNSDGVLNSDGSVTLVMRAAHNANVVYYPTVPSAQDHLGKSVYASSEITNHGPEELGATIAMYDGVAYQPQNSPVTVIPVGETRTVWGSVVDYIGGGTSWGNRLVFNGAPPQGQSFTVAKNGFFVGAPSEWFSGDYSPDPDLTPSWTGTPDASASILSGVAIGAQQAGRVVVQSGQWASSGSRSLRIIPQPDGGNGSAYAATVAGLVVGRRYTIGATLRIADTPTNPSGLIFARRISVLTTPVTDPSPAAPGVYEHRATFIAGGTSARIRLGGDTVDVWWDDLFVVEGEYDGPYFDGDSTLDDPDLTVGWADPNDTSSSASTITYTPAANHRGRSSDQWAASGERSLRVPTIEEIAGAPVIETDAPWRGTSAGGTALSVGRYEGETRQMLIHGHDGGDRYAYVEPTRWVSNNVNRGDYNGHVRWSAIDHIGSSSLGLGRNRNPGQDLYDWLGPIRSVWFDTYLTPKQVEEVVQILYTQLGFVNLDAEQKFSIVARDAGQQVFLDGVLYRTTKRSIETVVVKSPGYVGLGAGYWDNGMVTRKDYDGPYFDGDTPPFRYQGQVVRPVWTDEDPEVATSQLADYYEVEPWTPTAEWSKPENRRYSIGADRGMLYRDGLGVPWSGLVSVNRNGNDSEVGKRYLDGVLFNVSVPPSDFSASLEAFTYPDEFDACIGNANYNGVEGLVVHGQESVPFDLCYRTLQGDGNGHGEDYILHFVYGCMAVDSGHDHASINDSPEAETFSFEIHGVPQAVPNARPSSYFSIDSRKVNRGLLEGLEQVLYGTDGAQPRIPTMEEIETYFA